MNSPFQTAQVVRAAGGRTGTRIAAVPLGRMRSASLVKGPVVRLCSRRPRMMVRQKSVVKVRAIKVVHNVGPQQQQCMSWSLLVCIPRTAPPNHCACVCEDPGHQPVHLCLLADAHGWPTQASPRSPSGPGRERRRKCRGRERKYSPSLPLCRHSLGKPPPSQRCK